MTSSNNPRGLEPEEAARRLAEHGRNELPPPPRRGLGRIAAHVMTEPMFLLLALAAVAYLVLGEPAEGALLGGFAVVTIGLVVVQERRSERALEALRALGAPVAVVIRAGIAQRLAQDGYAVILHSRSSAEAGAALAHELGNALYVQADLSQDAERIKLLETALAAWGRLDLLVNHAGISRVIPHADLAAATPAIWHELHEVNVVAPFRLVALAENALRAAAQRGRPGCVVNISSHAGIRPKGASIPYAASKAALNHMTKLLALSLAPDIRVNAIAPGLVDTPLTAAWTDAQKLWREHAPMRRAAQPQDIAQAVAMIAASDYMTGEILLLDGGLNLT